MKNIYHARFVADCPVNGKAIDYELKIATRATIPVEAITDKLAELTDGFHEHFADVLIDAFGGRQTLTAVHHGVRIKTKRSTT